MLKRRLFGVIGMVLMILFFPSFSQAAEPIKIGFVHSLSGGGSVYGKPCLDAAEIAAAEINAKGGVLGRKIEIIARDDKTKPDDGLREAKDLVLSKKVDYLMGTVSSAVALAISGFAKEQKKIFCVATAQSTAITSEKGHRYVFRISTNNSAYCRSAARRAAELPYTKYYMIGPDYEYGHSSNKEFWTELKGSSQTLNWSRKHSSLWGLRISNPTSQRSWPQEPKSVTAATGVATGLPSLNRGKPWAISTKLRTSVKTMVTWRQRWRWERICQRAFLAEAIIPSGP